MLKQNLTLKSLINATKTSPSYIKLSLCVIKTRNVSRKKVRRKTYLNITKRIRDIVKEPKTHKKGKAILFIFCYENSLHF